MYTYKCSACTITPAQVCFKCDNFLCTYHTYVHTYHTLTIHYLYISSLLYTYKYNAFTVCDQRRCVSGLRRHPNCDGCGNEKRPRNGKYHAKRTPEWTCQKCLAKKMPPVRCHPRKVPGLVCDLCISTLQSWLWPASSQQKARVPCPKQTRVVL